MCVWSSSLFEYFISQKTFVQYSIYSKISQLYEYILKCVVMSIYKTACIYFRCFVFGVLYVYLF